MKYVRVIDGPNMNLVGRVGEKFHGEESVEEYIEDMKGEYPFEIKYIQTNYEGDVISELQRSGYDCDCIGIVLNAGAYASRESIAETIGLIPASVVAVELDNDKGDNIVSHKAKGTIRGLGLDSYHLALEATMMNWNSAE